MIIALSILAGILLILLLRTLTLLHRMRSDRDYWYQQTQKWQQEYREAVAEFYQELIDNN